MTHDFCRQDLRMGKGFRPLYFATLDTLESRSRRAAFVFFLISTAWLSGCANTESSSSTSSGGSTSPWPSGPPEATYLGNVSGSNYVNSIIAAGIVPAAGPYTVSGTARYQYRDEVTGSLAGYRPIRRAEVRVSNSSGTVVLGTETDNSGGFTFSIPSDNQTYTVSITSRGANAYTYASVLNKLEYNQFYSISQSFTASSTQNLGNITASATDSAVTAGAFNIFDQILNAHLYLANQAGNCSSTHTGCLNFSSTTMKKITAYWSLGFNPASYINGGPVSFVTEIRGEPKLMLLGGSNGAYLNVDTDHWDNSVIIHEFGHMMEYLYGRMDSPGGSHNGNSTIDPRLAWSEGFANFIQAAVRGQADYRDMAALDSGSPSTLVYRPFTNTTGNDPVSANGEGVYREFSISRQLWSYIDGGNHFRDLWAIFSGESVGGTTGFRSTGLRFRNIELFWSRHQQLSGAPGISTILSSERSSSSRVYYGIPVSSGSCTQTGTLTNSSTAFQNNNPSSGFRPHLGHRFYEYTHGGGSLSVSVQCSACTSSDDIDLYVYRQTHVLGSTSTMLAFSNAENTSAYVVPSVSVSAAAGTYLIDVNRFSGSTSRNFDLMIGGQKFCP